MKYSVSGAAKVDFYGDLWVQIRNVRKEYQKNIPKSPI